MCGIVGYVGKSATELIWDALSRLNTRVMIRLECCAKRREYFVKCKGRLADLKGKVNEQLQPPRIGHIRWATHGIPSDSNAHPHTDRTDK